MAKLEEDDDAAKAKRDTVGGDDRPLALEDAEEEPQSETYRQDEQL